LPLDKLKQHLTRGEYVQARREAERLIHVGDLSPEDLVQAYRGAALANYYVGEIFAAIKLCEKALDQAQNLRNLELIGRSRYDLGEYYLTLGDAHQAHEQLLEFLSDLDRYPQLSELEAKAHHNLALVFRQRRDYESAIASHTVATGLFERDGNERMRIESVRGLVWCYLTQGDYTAAFPQIEQISTYLELFPEPSLSASLLTDLAYYHHQAGNITRSMEFCEEAMMPGRPGVDDHIMATACIIAGQNCVDLNRAKEAQVFLDLALDYSIKAKGPFLMNWATALRRRLHGME
jgi:tetratricopeptide (TPR) repeat protein